MAAISFYFPSILHSSIPVLWSRKWEMDAHCPVACRIDSVWCSTPDVRACLNPISARWNQVNYRLNKFSFAARRCHNLANPVPAPDRHVRPFCAATYLKALGGMWRQPPNLQGLLAADAWGAESQTCSVPTKQRVQAPPSSAPCPRQPFLRHWQPNVKCFLSALTMLAFWASGNISFKIPYGRLPRQPGTDKSRHPCPLAGGLVLPAFEKRTCGVSSPPPTGASRTTMRTPPDMVLFHGLTKPSRLEHTR